MKKYANNTVNRKIEYSLGIGRVHLSVSSALDAPIHTSAILSTATTSTLQNYAFHLSLLAMLQSPGPLPTSTCSMYTIAINLTTVTIRVFLCVSLCMWLHIQSKDDILIAFFYQDPYLPLLLCSSSTQELDCS